jgi:aspartate carbamoyltransferase catalytic subunit
MLSPELQYVKNGYNSSCSGDIWLRLMPGWHMAKHAASASNLVRRGAVNFPMVLYGNGITPEYIKEEVLKAKNIEFVETTNLEEVIPQLDILYMTRVQRERFFNEQDYIRLKDSYILTPEKLEKAKDDMCILHPLPRVNEISVAVDDDPRAKYFEQAKNGKYIRMALILKLLEVE